jgi:sensor histidine kinase YesM
MQNLKKISAYWWCQIAGWGANALVNIFFSWTFKGVVNAQFIGRVLILTVIGVGLTHLMRWVLIRLNVLMKSFERQLVYFLAITISFSFLLASLMLFLFSRFHLIEETEQKFSLASRLIGTSFNAFVTLLVWNLIYFIYHYVERFRNQQIEALQTESLIRELQLQTIKSHINPHFIFNALNSIRALIDENPERARKAVTELSNILRNSMLAEKVETVPFEKELNIVKDYLALEQMRFEERLQVQFEIEERTLTNPVPPMMLQTLVENAIKHGISKNIKGGTVTIVSRFSEGRHLLSVRNSGTLESGPIAEGFGVSGTQNRLRLMYGDKASFSLKNAWPGIVEAEVQMPLAV